MINLNGDWCHPSKGFTIDAFTLGRHLCRIPRFGGALDTFYSVGQHSLFVASMMRADGKTPREQLAGLLHDRGEFPRGDIPTDWKTDADRETEGQVERLCLQALGLEEFSLAERIAVKPYDREACIVEGNIVAPLCLEKMPEKYVNPELVAKRIELFRHFYVREPARAFHLNWYTNGSAFFPVQFAHAFDKLRKEST